MNQYKYIILCIVSTILVVNYSHSGELGPGIYHGYFSETCWGQNVFFIGPNHLFVSNNIASQLKKYKGRPLELKVSELSQPINPGAGLIQKVSEISEKGIAEGLVLSIKTNSKKYFQGEGVSLHLGLKNNSKSNIKIWAGTLAIILATDSPFSSKDINYKDPDDCAYWYYHYSYYPFEKDKESYQIACRRILLPWQARDIVNLGHNIHVADNDSSFNGPIIIEPKGGFETDYIIGKELLPDDYEVFFYIDTGNFSSIPGPMSQRIIFDVLKK